MNLALFDLDNTLLACDSDYEWGQFLVDRGVLRLVLAPVEHAAVHKELPPFVIAVAGEQGIVEVEQG